MYNAHNLTQINKKSIDKYVENPIEGGVGVQKSDIRTEPGKNLRNVKIYTPES